MGHAYSHQIERAGKYLLSLLASEDRVIYSRFYDGSDETHFRLLVEMGYSVPDDDEAPDCPEGYIDLAVGQLESAGMVKTRDTGALLADDEPEYEIELTSLGREFLAAAKQFEFHDEML